MAEVFATATGVLQVAEVGFSLAATLYKYAAAVKGAEKDIKKIARDVKLTSKVLERTHEQIKADQQAQLCTDEALYDLEDVLDGCREAFEEVDEALKGSMKVDAKGDSKISIAERLKWPLKHDKMDVLRANLEKLKTTLLLMLSVLAYGNKMQQQRQSATMKLESEFALEKLQIQNLVQAKDEATRRFEELSAAFAKMEASINSKVDRLPGGTKDIEAKIAMTAIALPDVQQSSAGQHRQDAHPVTTRLGLCAAAVSKLTTTIDAATKRWNMYQILEHDHITHSLHETTQAVVKLRDHAKAHTMPHHTHPSTESPLRGNGLDVRFVLSTEDSEDQDVRNDFTNPPPVLRCPNGHIISPASPRPTNASEYDTSELGDRPGFPTDSIDQDIEGVEYWQQQQRKLSQTYLSKGFARKYPSDPHYRGGEQNDGSKQIEQLGNKHANTSLIRSPSAVSFSREAPARSLPMLDAEEEFGMDFSVEGPLLDAGEDLALDLGDDYIEQGEDDDLEQQLRSAMTEDGSEGSRSDEDTGNLCESVKDHRRTLADVDLMISNDDRIRATREEDNVGQVASGASADIRKLESTQDDEGDEEEDAEKVVHHLLRRWTRVVSMT